MRRCLLLTTDNPAWQTKSGNILWLSVKGHGKIHRANKYSEILPVSQRVRASCQARCGGAFLKSFLNKNNRMTISPRCCNSSIEYDYFSHRTERYRTPTVPYKAFSCFPACPKVFYCSRSPTAPSKKLAFLSSCLIIPKGTTASPCVSLIEKS